MKKILPLLVSLVSFCSVGYSVATTRTAIQPLNSIVAEVNSDIITQSSLNAQVAMMKQQLQLSNQPVPSDSKLRTQILDQMIDQKLVLQAAAKAKINVTNAQIDTAISNIAKENHLTLAQLKQQLIKQGMPYSEYQKQIEQQILISETERAAVGNTIHVSKAEISSAMKKISQQSQGILQYHLQALLVPVSNLATTEQIQSAKNMANNIVQQLKSGGDIASLIASQSTASEALQGGDMGWKQLEELPASMSAEIAAAVAGSIIGPIETPNGLYILKVLATRTIGATKQSAAASENQIQQTIYFQKFEQASQKWVKQLRSTAYIKIMNG